MKLLVLVLNRVEKLNKLLNELAKHGLTGATVISSNGLAHELIKSNDESLSNIFGSLRRILNPNERENKTIFMVVKEERVPEITEIVEQVIGSILEPDTGIIFTVPVEYLKGMKH